MARIIDADIEKNWLMVRCSFQCMAQGHFYVIVVSDRNIAALYRVGEGTPIDIAQLRAGTLTVTDPLAVINPREFAVIENTVNRAEIFSDGGERFHATHQHGAVAEYAYNLLIGIHQFCGVDRGYAVAHGIKA